jgi:hypothetical protein
MSRWPRRVIASRSFGVCLLALAAAIARGQTIDRPAALQRAVEQRLRLSTGRVECSHDMWAESADGEHDWHRFTYVTARFGERDRIWSQRGDDDGVLLRDRQGKPAASSSRRTGPLHTLWDDGVLWRRQEGFVESDRYVDGRTNNLVLDMRTLGLHAGLDFRDAEEVVWQDPGRAKRRVYTEEAADGLRLVTAKRDDGAVMRWWIDPERGWNPVRVRIEFPEVWAESRTTLQKLDGVWFPETVEYYSSRWKKGKHPKDVIKVQDARFNEPGQPADFGPGDIGIERGATIILRDSRHQEVNMGFFDGRDFVAINSYYDKTLASYREGSQPAAEVGDPTEHQARVDRTRAYESEWERYTREFIAEYTLSEEQTQKAWQVCRDCQTLAQNYLNRRREHIGRFERELSALKGIHNKKERRAKAAALAEVIDKLCRPVEEIFEKQLKPRLERLPTRKQRTEAEKKR